MTQIFKSRFDRLMRVRGVNSSQFRILAGLLNEIGEGESTSITVECIGELCELNHETVGRNCDKLVAKGLLERERIAVVGTCKPNYAYRLPTICVPVSTPSTPAVRAA